MGREVDLVDDEEIGARDAGAALGGNFVAGGDVDHVDREIGELRGKRRGEIVATGFDQDQVERGKLRAHLGDRVEVDIIHVDVDHGGNPAYQRWKKGTILQADTGTAKRYVIQLDPIPGQVPVIHTIPMYDETCCIRPFGGVAPKIQTDKLRVDENGTVLADRELLDCDNLKHAGRNGSPPQPELIKKLIRCLFEKPSPAGQDGATTMDITEFTIGSPHRWRDTIDSGQGTANTLVYPVHVKWNTKKFLRDRNNQVTEAEATFTCFADAMNLWQ